MATFKLRRRHLTIHRHPFHTASYKGRSANPRGAQLAYPAVWYLMVDGRRRPVLPCDSPRSLLELDAALRDYAEANTQSPSARKFSTPSAPGAARPQVPGESPADPGPRGALINNIGGHNKITGANYAFNKNETPVCYAPGNHE